MRDRFQTVGAIVVGADHEPPQAEMFLLTALAQLAGAALANVALRERACAEAMGYNLHGEHNVVLVHDDDSASADAVGRAAADGRVEQFMREWLGTLLDYDRDHRADLVHTSSRYLECGGNYDDRPPRCTLIAAPCATGWGASANSPASTRAHGGSSPR
ncbi:hypothetical protein [Nocardia gipuzkoensis]|uniref:hypothetical protein n=1 Tax=Nocardia gipuzkoensis TaxID=2749991 RepID=UPI003B8A6B49